MTAQLSLLQINADVLTRLASHNGPCVTALIPANHPGAGEANRLTALRSLLQSLPLSENTDLKLLMEKTVRDLGLSAGGSGLVVFGSAAGVEVYRASIESPRIIAGDRLFLLPFLLEAFAPREFLILGLSKQMLRLILYQNSHCIELSLPAEMPASLEAFRTAARHDWDAQNNAPAGSAQGKLRSVQFGTSSEREDTPIHLEHFFARVDQCLAPELRKRSLLLMGIAEETACFRRTAKHCPLLDGQITAGMRDLHMGEIAQLARHCAQQQRRAEGSAILARIAATSGRQLVLDDAGAILAAAKAGRVHQLCVPETAAGQHTEHYDEQLLNSAVTAVLAHSGEVFTIQTRDLHPAHPMHALLRF